MRLSVFRVAFMFVGALMGAGFASGKEIWQFFGIFGVSGLWGILATTILFTGLGFTIVWIGIERDTDDISKIILPVNNPVMEKVTAVVVMSFLFMAFFSMLAAGGALFQQQLGMDSKLGSCMLAAAAVFAAINGFNRVSSVMGRVVPVLLTGTILLSFYLLTQFILNGTAETYQEAMEQVEASPLAQNWPSAALAYVSYNMLGVVAILGGCAHLAENKKNVKKGVLLGGVILGMCALILYGAVSTDPLLSAGSSLPMLELSSRLGAPVKIIYGFILLCAIFGTATSCFYSLSTKVTRGKGRRVILLLIAAAGLLFSFLGFESIVAVVYPIEGYVAVVFLIMMVYNALRIKHNKINEANVKNIEIGEMNDKKYNIKGDQYPMTFEGRQTENEATRVTGGPGGEALLFIGSEKTALYDAGMEFYSLPLIDNIVEALGSRPLDYVLLSHTHYDHCGGIPQLKKQWPQLVVLGSEHGKKILEKPSARKLIKELRDSALEKFPVNPEELPEYDDSLLQIDEAVKEGDVISLGDKWFEVYETPGHTRCSLAFVLKPSDILLASETTGCYISDERLEMPILTGFQDTAASIEKMKKLQVKKIYSPHYLLLDDDIANRFWDLALEEMETLKEFILDMYDREYTLDEMVEEAKEVRWTKVEEEQPLEAFVVNIKATIRVVLGEFRGVSVENKNNL